MNKLYRMNLLWFLLLLYACSNKGTDCSSLPLHYKSYSEAINIIESADFKITENLNTSKSSWIRGASYYSCDGNVGFLIVKTDTQDYIYAGIPVGLWNGFKNADSFGRYFNQNIKGRYSFNLK